MSRRFFFQSETPQLPEINDTVKLDSREAHHLIHVIRANVGDRLKLFDGSGFEFEGEIEEIKRNEVAVIIRERQKVDRELACNLVVAIPFPKADRQKFLVEKLTEIGVTSVVFLNSSRSGAQGNEKTLVKLRQIVIEASKQCGRNRLMNLKGPVDLNTLVQNVGEFCDHASQKLFAHVGSSARTSSIEDQGKIVLIGPEGGWESTEVDTLLENNWHPISLGKTILRMETAAIVAGSLLSSH